MKEAFIEAYLVDVVETLGGEVRKVKWIGRNNAPDRLVMLPPYRLRPEWRKFTDTHLVGKYPDTRMRPAQTFWVEVKNPETVKTFPANAHERAQAREHERMRAFGQRVEVVGTYEQVDALFK